MFFASQLFSSPRKKNLLFTLAALLAAQAAFAQGRGGGTNSALGEFIRTNYTKYEYRIAMRDGVKLFTSVYVPNDTNQTYPIMLQRTPYSVQPYGSNAYRRSLGPSELFAREGFIFAYQDVRGRYQSEGVFDDPPAHKHHFTGPTDSDESTDSYDTIDWLVKNIPNNNGRVGTWGISYPGFFSAFTLIDAHPALKAASPQAPMADVGNGDDAYHNGAFFLAENFDFYVTFRPKNTNAAATNSTGTGFYMGTPDEYDFFRRMGTLGQAEDKYFKHQNEFWTTLIHHDTYDQFWADRALSPQMHHLTSAVLVVGGWFDSQDLGGTPKLFQAIDKDGSAPSATFVMGPWTHGSWAGGNGDTLDNLRFTENTAAFYRENIEFPFFLKNLKDKGDGLKTTNDPTTPKAWIFATGTNHWYRFASWPPPGAVRRSLYLAPGGKLSFTAPAGGGSQYDEYVSDPAKPVPVTSEIGVDLSRDYMAYDQRFASTRPDVLTYETEPLDRPITIAGPITPVLRVSTSDTDSDFVVKLIDVYPNSYRDPQAGGGGGGGRRGGAAGAVPMQGFQMLVRGEPFRGKFRDSMSKPEPFKPNRATKLQFTMPDAMHTFLPGHRIMVQIQSSWFPLTDINPQKFIDMPSAKPADYQKASERVYRGRSDGSRLDLLITDPTDLK
jgi:putative CocE/NonD family hydrolase